MDSELLNALELARQGQWERAHEIVQNRSDQAACWIHAYLHRVEGDEGNAGYWYRQASKPFPNQSFNDEWQQIRDAVASE